MLICQCGITFECETTLLLLFFQAFPKSESESEDLQNRMKHAIMSDDPTLSDIIFTNCKDIKCKGLQSVRLVYSFIYSDLFVNNATYDVPCNPKVQPPRPHLIWCCSWILIKSTATFWKIKATELGKNSVKFLSFPEFQ